MGDSMNRYAFEAICENIVRESLGDFKDITEKEIQEVMDKFKDLIDIVIDTFGTELEHTDYSSFLLGHIIGLYLLINRINEKNS